MTQRVAYIVVLCAINFAACGTAPVVPAETHDPYRVLSRNAPSHTESALPPATRQIAEGYWLGALIGPNDVPHLQELGVRAVLSAVRPADGTAEALRRAGIAHFSIPIGSTFRHADTILSVTERYPPHEVFIHCRHGADRTGAIAAFLLVVRHNWRMSDALYSVVYPTQEDADGLARVLDSHGVTDERAADDPSVGFYSISGTGRAVGGMKVRNSRYANLVETAIEAMMAHSE